MIEKDLIKEDGEYSNEELKKMLNSNTKEKVEYPIFEILYENDRGKQSNAVVSEQSGIEAIKLLCGAFEKKGELEWKLKSYPIAKCTKFKTYERGIISAYDSLGNNLIDF